MRADSVTKSLCDHYLYIDKFSRALSDNERAPTANASNLNCRPHKYPGSVSPALMEGQSFTLSQYSRKGIPVSSNIVVLQALVHTSILSRLIIILHSIYLKDDLIEGFLMGVNHSVDIFDVH